MSESHKGLKPSAETRAKLSAARMGVVPWNRGLPRVTDPMASPEARAKVSASKKAHAAADLPDCGCRVHLHKHGPTRIEDRLGEMLREAFPAYELIREHRVGSYRIDWAIPELMLAYEADGTYWHSLPTVAAKDIRRDAWLTSKGWTVVRYDEAELS